MLRLPLRRVVQLRRRGRATVVTLMKRLLLHGERRVLPRMLPVRPQPAAAVIERALALAEVHRGRCLPTLRPVFNWQVQSTPCSQVQSTPCSHTLIPSSKYTVFTSSKYTVFTSSKYTVFTHVNSTRQHPPRLAGCPGPKRCALKHGDPRVLSYSTGVRRAPLGSQVP